MCLGVALLAFAASWTRFPNFIFGCVDYAERGYVATVVLDVSGAVSDAYGIHATPTTFLIARDGTIVGRAIGPRAWAGPDARALFQALLAPPAK